jgi:hypothetical protein
MLPDGSTEMLPESENADNDFCRDPAIIFPDQIVVFGVRLYYPVSRQMELNQQ